jgi:uncharacterized membrane protein YphA (DoxX/SURF4 family)
VLLRVGIGWHCLYEGLWKIDSHRDGGGKPFSAEGYINNSSGPLRPWFRAKLDDPDGLERLDADGVSRRWARTIAQLDRRYQLGDEQKQNARETIRKLEPVKEAYFSDPAIRARIDAYREEVTQVTADELTQKPAFIHDHAKERRKDLTKTRDELVAPVDAWIKSLRDKVTEGLTPEQVERDSRERLAGLAGWLHLPFKLEWPDTEIGRINMFTMMGLTICGGLLVIGFMSRLAALGAAAFIAAFYACNPAPPIGPGSPGDPGHYLYVNKELIECLAALVLACIPSGRWLGIDAFFHGISVRMGQRVAARPKAS